MHYSLLNIVLATLSVQQVVSTPLQMLVKRQQIDGLCLVSFNIHHLSYDHECD
jgi:hypothetical protein